MELALPLGCLVFFYLFFLFQGSRVASQTSVVWFPSATHVGENSPYNSILDIYQKERQEQFCPNVWGLLALNA